MSITVTTQQALDDAIAAGHEDIVVDSPRGVWVTVHASGSVTVHASGSATVTATGSVTVHASGSATVHAYNSATVHAYGSATVTAYDSATVHASGSATVTATPKVAVHLHSGRCTIAGGVLIDHTIIDLTDPQTWHPHQSRILKGLLP